MPTQADWLQAAKRNALDGVGIGLTVGAAFSVWVTVLRLAGGTQAFEKLGTTYPTVMASYGVGGLLVGLCYGLLTPLRRWTLGVMVTAFLCAAVAYGLIGLLTTPRERWGADVPPIAVGLGLFASLFFGLDDAWGKCKRRRAQRRGSDTSPGGGAA
jgi:hypothetical protein